MTQELVKKVTESTEKEFQQKKQEAVKEAIEQHCWEPTILV